MATILSHIVSLKVRLCSPFAAGHKLLVGASLDYPKLLRLALPNALHARISSVSCFCSYFYEFDSDIVYVQNLPRNICLRNFLDYCLEALAGVWDDAR